MSDVAPLTARRAQPPAEFLTRQQAAEFIRDELGRPFSFSTATKLASLGEFAEPAIWWGRRPLYRAEDLRAWVDARSTRTRPLQRDVAKDANGEPAP
jgi:hypothetical protein